MLPVDLTSTWIPLSLLAVLCSYMFVLFQRERRAALAYEGVEPTAPAVLHGGGGHAPVEAASAPAAVAHDHAAHAPAPAVHAPAVQAAAPEKKKSGLLWRTASLWLPFVAGFAGQAYFDIIKPLVEKAAG